LCAICRYRYTLKWLYETHILLSFNMSICLTLGQFVYFVTWGAGGGGNFCIVQANDSMAIGCEFLYSDEKVD